MTNPNIVNVSEIYGKVVGQEITITPTNIVTNSSSSDKIIKINSLIISNKDGTNSSGITAELVKNQTNSYNLAFTISVPADSTLVLISKDSSIYLEENDSIRLTATSDNDLHAICSYEEIS